MAILAQPPLHIATASNNTAGAIVRRKWQPGRAESSKWDGSLSVGGKLGCKVLALQSSSHELPLLQLHVHGGGLPVSKFQPPTSLVSTKWHWMGSLGVNHRSPRKGKAGRGDNDRSSSGEEAKDEETLDEQKDSNINGDEESAENQESGRDEPNPNETPLQSEESKSGFWRKIWEPGQKDEEETLDEQKDSNINGDEENAENQESGGDEPNPNETPLQSEESKSGFWRKIWEPGQKDEDNTLGPEEELLVQDLESLRFDWKGLLDPSPENLIALGFTVLLTLALFKILSQLVLVVITILLSALKYTVLAALLVGLLIFLI
ncbi:unnamed protein product [Calypogeia fissa]